MLKYFENGELQAQTTDLPQDCGEVLLTVTLEKECEDCDMFLEFDCPKNTKFASKKLEKIGAKSYQVALPRAVSANVGEVYTQLVFVSKTTQKLKVRSLKSRSPIFVISSSIMANKQW